MSVHSNSPPAHRRNSPTLAVLGSKLAIPSPHACHPGACRDLRESGTDPSSGDLSPLRSESGIRRANATDYFVFFSAPGATTP